MTLEYGRAIVFFNREGFDEGDETYGTDSTELIDDGALETELSFADGGDAVLTNRRE